jgi:hypothetical protein
VQGLVIPLMIIRNTGVSRISVLGVRERGSLGWKRYEFQLDMSSLGSLQHRLALLWF